MIDTHSHLYDEAFDNDREEVIRRAKDVGVSHIVLSNVDMDTIFPMNSLFEKDQSYFSMAMGLHPTSVKGEETKALDQIRRELETQKYCAVGEVGVDLYWNTTYREEQMEVFAKQIEFSLEFNLPLIIHTRKAFPEIFTILHRYRKESPTGVFHFFGGGIEEAKKAISMGFYLGIGGVLTYKNSHLSNVVKEVGVNHLLLETDAPYLSPVPFRGKRNEPSYLVETEKVLAKYLDLGIDEVKEITDKNARLLFNIV